jgi:hypothetical protein
MGKVFVTARGRGFFPALSIVMLCLVGFTACPEPIPLYGTWADSQGSTLTFEQDDVFGGDIIDSGTGITTVFKGSYTVLLNALTINCTDPYVLRVVTEWDIRGNMLYITWTNGAGVSTPLTLYKISN